MAQLLTAAQMRAVEREAIEAGSVSGLELMERAGAGVVEAMLEEWPELAEGGHRAVVLCGPGNNGGDGFVVARLLKQRGWELKVLLFGDPDRLAGDAKRNFERWRELGELRPLIVAGAEDELELDAFEEAAWSEGPQTRVIIDALFGTGLSRPLGALANLMQEVALLEDDEFGDRFLRVAIDVPSGLCSDSGRVLDDDPDPWSHSAFRADLTVTFHKMKLGHVLCDGPDHCGKVVAADIGLARSACAAPVGTVDLCASMLGKTAKTHKYRSGHALVLSGGAGRTGAARLAARAALRVGAGLVTLGVPGSALMECAAQVTAIMLRRVEDGGGLGAVLEDGRLNALCLGPGLGLERARALVPVALGGAGGEGGSRTHPTRAVVLDADALTAFEDVPERFFGMLHENCVLTPHGGEFARLFPDLAQRLREPPRRGPAFSKVDATREAAARAGCVVLFKGPDTVIAAPAGQCSVNAAVYDRAAPWLATAGAGDVLAGMICGLMARGFPAMQAAETAAGLHVECARSFGPGLIAEDLPDMLPKVFRDLGL